jgi:hypothetical protein
MYAWNSISKAGFRAAMPRSIARELRQQARRESEINNCRTVAVADADGYRNPEPGISRKVSTASQNSKEARELPKGCYCQVPML